MTTHPDEDLAWTPAWRLKEMFAAKELSPLEYARFLLARAERLADLGAFISLFPEHLLEQATAATEQLTRGGDTLPLLHGLPVGVKDSVFTKGQRTTLASLLFKDHVPETDSVASERLKQAGAIIFGKTNMPEFELNRRSMNLLVREAVNPWDRTRTSGGSSGGAAVAGAAGIGPLQVGVDGGGSIRIPSSFNGLFGLLPSRGRVPDGAGYFSLPTSGIGPMTRDVRDAAMLFQAMACCDERDAKTMRSPPPDYLAQLEDGVADLRFGWSPDLGRVIPDEPAIIDICHAAAQFFATAGASYTEEPIRLEDPHDELEQDTEYSKLQLAKQFRALLPDYQDPLSWAAKLPPEQYAQLTIYIRDRSDRPNMLDYAQSITPAIRHKPKTRLADLFGRIDLLLCPVIARTAFVCGIGGVTPWQYTAYTHIVNVSGYCAASVPAGFHEGMPVGLQIIGRPGEEHLILRAARAFERERPWAHLRPPSV
jgi:Asp-tRNA(Asn)/Glu-tRNA(Gln) amidotransferase A subunit family amidase